MCKAGQNEGREQAAVGEEGRAAARLDQAPLGERTFQREDGTTGISQYVFHVQGQAIGDIRDAWARACRKAGLVKPLTDHKGAICFDEHGKPVMVPSRTYHGFRRTAYLHMIESGVSEATARMIVGHKTDAMARRYQIVPLRHKEEAVARLSI